MTGLFLGSVCSICSKKSSINADGRGLLFLICSNNTELGRLMSTVLSNISTDPNHQLSTNKNFHWYLPMASTPRLQTSAAADLPSSLESTISGGQILARVISVSSNIAPNSGKSKIRVILNAVPLKSHLA